MGANDSTDSLEAELASLRLEYAAELPAKTAAIQKSSEAVITALGSQLTPDWAALRMLVHRLAGSSGTYGFMHLHEIAIFLDSAISSGRLLSATPNTAAAYLSRWYSLFAQYSRASMDGTISSAAPGSLGGPTNAHDLPEFLERQFIEIIRTQTGSGKAAA